VWPAYRLYNAIAEHSIDSNVAKAKIRAEVLICQLMFAIQFAKKSGSVKTVPNPRHLLLTMCLNATRALAGASLVSFQRF
jgi:hypothetical protein